jgi:hypothetical protein
VSSILELLDEGFPTAHRSAPRNHDVIIGDKLRHGRGITRIPGILKRFLPIIYYRLASVCGKDCLRIYFKPQTRTMAAGLRISDLLQLRFGFLELYPNFNLTP